MTKRFSLKNKLILIFGALIAAASVIEGVFAVRIARKAVSEKVEAHLTGKARDVAEIINGRLEAFFQFAEGLARMPELTASNSSSAEKTHFLTGQTGINDDVLTLAFIDMQGFFYTADGRKLDLQSHTFQSWTIRWS